MYSARLMLADHYHVVSGDREARPVFPGIDGGGVSYGAAVRVVSSSGFGHGSGAHRISARLELQVGGRVANEAPHGQTGGGRAIPLHDSGATGGRRSPGSGGGGRRRRDGDSACEAPSPSPPGHSL